MKLSKKIIAFALACLMTSAIVAPMTATASAVTEIEEIYLSVTAPKAGDNCTDIANSITINSVVDQGDNPLPTTSVTVTVAGWYIQETSTTITEPFNFEFEGGKTYDMTLYVETAQGYAFIGTGFYPESIEINGESAQDTSLTQTPTSIFVKTSFTVSDTLITNVAITAPTPVAGQKIKDYSSTIAPTPENSVKAPEKEYWYSKNAGADKSEYKLITDENAVFEAGKDYKYGFIAFANAGYELSIDNTAVTINGANVQYAVALITNLETPANGLIPSVEFSIPAPKTTPKAGDTTSPVFYVIALISLVSAAGVTVLATRKK